MSQHSCNLSNENGMLAVQTYLYEKYQRICLSEGKANKMEN